MAQVAVFLLNGYADWELGFVLPGIADSPEGKVVTFSLDGKPVVSMGGLRVTPDTSIDKIKPADYDMLILPGAKAWQVGEIRPITELGKAFLAEDRPVAGICGATLAVGWMGKFGEIAHTSNAVEYLEQFLPGYNGQANYVKAPAITGGKLITASGLGAIEFTREVLKMLKTHPDEEIEGWYQMLKSGGIA
jgi:putative intracellular protease/amidase